MHWILQDTFSSEPGWADLIAALDRLELSSSLHDVVPGSGELVPPAPRLNHRNVLCIGSYSLRHLALREHWSPGVFDLAGCDFAHQREHWGEHLLNASSVISTVRDARFTADALFVRPVADTKSFTGRVFSRAEFEEWRATRPGAGSTLGEATEIQLAPLRTIHAEYRFWIVRGRIVTRSLYRRGGRVYSSGEVDTRLDRFVEARLAEWEPHQAFVIDVCETDEGLRIVELNTLNSAAFYAADLQRLVIALEEGFTERTCSVL